MAASSADHSRWGFDLLPLVSFVGVMGDKVLSLAIAFGGS